MMKITGITICLFFVVSFAKAQTLGATSEYVKQLTSRWEGERFTDGRPKISDLTLERLENCTIEQIWGYLMMRGFHNQVVTDWQIIKPGETMVGRAVTTQFMPSRPDLDSIITVYGKQENRSQHGGQNIWPIDVLVKGDIYVADGYEKVKDGTLIGSSLGNAIYGKTGKGVIFYGSVRDMQELRDTKGFNAWIRGQDPSYIKDMTPTSINAPIRIGTATVFPGDAVFANDYGVAFIPAYLVNGLVSSAEYVGLRDEFERFILQQNKFPAGEIHGEWSDKVKTEFRSWLGNYPGKIYLTNEEIDNYLNRGSR